MEKILENIELIRKNKRIKQTVIAEELGVKQNTYSNYINRSGDIPYSRLSRIADILNVSIIDIITYPDKYVKETDKCENCRTKEDIIKNLNNYIKTLEERCKK